VPSLPAQRLIIGQAELTFGVLEDALHPIAVPLHLGQTQRLRVSWGVGQAVLDRPRKGAYLTQLQGFRSDKSPDVHRDDMTEKIVHCRQNVFLYQSQIGLNRTKTRATYLNRRRQRRLFKAI